MTLYPPGGGGRIRFFERLAPLQRFSQVIGAVLANDPEFRVSVVHGAQTVITDEGEYGAWVRVNGSREGRSVVRFIGAVFGDEFVAAIDAFVMLPDQLATLELVARDLLLNSTFGFGVRRRRFVYQPPSGWRGLPSGLVTTWYPPDFPNNRVNLVVFPAEPPILAPVDVVDVHALLETDRGQGFALDEEVEQSDLMSVGGLGGRRGSYTVGRGDPREVIRREVATFVTPQHAYILRMESRTPARASEHHELFLATARSVMPIPLPGRSRIGGQLGPSSAATISHWID